MRLAQSADDLYTRLGIRRNGQEVRWMARETFTVDGEYGGFLVSYTREVQDDESFSLEGMIAYLVSQGLAPSGSTAAVSASAPAPATGCPFHGTEKVGLFNGKHECKVTVWDEPTATSGNWRKCVTKTGKVFWACDQKWD